MAPNQTSTASLCTFLNAAGGQVILSPKQVPLWDVSMCETFRTGARAGFSTMGHGSSPWVSTPAYPGVASSDSSLILTHSYHRQGGGITVTPKTSDVVVVSPQAGNCFDMAVPRRGDCYRCFSRPCHPTAMAPRTWFLQCGGMPMSWWCRYSDEYLGARFSGSWSQEYHRSVSVWTAKHWGWNPPQYNRKLGKRKAC